MSTISTEHPLPFRHLWPLEAIPAPSLHRAARIALSSSHADAAVIRLLDDGNPWYTTGMHADQLSPTSTSSLTSLLTQHRETAVFTQSDLFECLDEVPTLDNGERAGYVVGTPLTIDLPSAGKETSPIGLLFVVGSASSPGPHVKECIDHLGGLLEEQIWGWITRHGAAQLFENLSEALLTLDGDSCITFVNRQAETLLECPRNHLLGQKVWSVLPETIGTSTKEQLRTAIADHQSVTFRLHHPELQLWLQVQSIPFDGGHLVQLDDVTKEVKRKERLSLAQQRAEQADRLKSTFLANMSHEIRTPLTSILGFAEALQDQIATLETNPDTTDLGPLSQFTSLIEKGGYRLLNTLNSLINLSKLEAEEMGVSLQAIDLDKVVRETVNMYDAEAEEKDIELRLDLQDSPVRGVADRRGVRIALQNVLSNAVKYTEEGGWIEVRLREQHECALLEIKDCGIGMDPERVPELFEAFRQESTGTSRTYEGAGLGLTVTKRLVDLMEGTIEVDSEKGKGTQFVVRFPRPPGSVDS